VQTLANGQVALDTTLTFDDPSITFQANYAKKKIDQLELAGLWAPLAAGILGLVALVGGILLLRTPRQGRHGRTSDRTAPLPPPLPTESTPASMP
jgi:hypothetical protein